MKSFLEFLIEMSVDDAMKLFGLKEVPSDKRELDKQFKKLALKHHPDLGGSLETMKLINQAKDLLSKNLGSSSSTTKKQDDSDYAKRLAHVRKVIKELFDRFDENVYKKVLDDAFGISFSAKVDFDDPTKITDKYASGYHTLKMEFADEERDKVFELYFTIDEYEVHRQMYVVKSLDGKSSGERIFKVSVRSFVFIDGKKQVLSKDRLFRTDDPKIFTDASILLPKTKVSKLAKGELRKDSKLAKRDFEGLFKTKFDATMESSGGHRWYYIPVNDFVVIMYRTTSLGAAYHLYGVGRKPTSNYRRYDKFIENIGSSKYGYLVFKEDAEGFAFIKKALMELDKTGNYEAFLKDFGAFGNSWLKKYE